MLQLICDEKHLQDSPYALNEIAILKRDSSSMISIRTAINGAYLNTYQADGLVIATPTGSTAYSLSVGGPIIVPHSNTIAITPVAPHSLNVRPIVIRDDWEITLDVESRSHNFLVAIDGRSETCKETTQLTIRRADYSIKVVTSARISDILTPGDETETDDEFRARIEASLNSRSFGGNVAQYVEEIKKLDGVGAVQVYPTWRGGGTVLCSVLGADWLPASTDLVQTIQNTIDPVPYSGQGLGLAPIGAKVTITAPEKLEVSVTASVTLLPSYSLDTVRTAVREALEAYLLNVRKSWETNISKTGIEYSANVYTARVSAAIITAEGVVNVTNVQLNGAADDLILTETGAQQQVPVVGTVTLHEA